MSEKNEALAHQKLAAQVLANKLLKYEKKEGRKSDSDSSTDARVKKSDGKHRKQTPNYKLDIYIKDSSVSDAHNDVFKERNPNVENSSFEEDYFYDPIENNVEEENILGHTSNHKSNELKCPDSLQSVNTVTNVNLNTNHEKANHSDHVSFGYCGDVLHNSSNHGPDEGKLSAGQSHADQHSRQASKSNSVETNGGTRQENILSQVLDEPGRSSALNTDGVTHQAFNS